MPLNRVVELVRTCGTFLRDVDRSQMEIDTKSGRANFVTEYDRLVQQKLQAGLRAILPDVKFVGEEGSAEPYSPKGAYWIVDPIDGTTNFIKDYHHSSISVALIVDGEARMGVIGNPYTDEIFAATRGEGAWCNGKRLSVSPEPLENAVVIFGTAPYDRSLTERTFSLARSFFDHALDIRRSGSAALDLCAVAAGRAEVFFELRLSPWDYAAGGLIVQEAGGTVSELDGRPLAFDRPCSVLARGSGISRDADWIVSDKR